MAGQERLEEIRERHRNRPQGSANNWRPWCTYCSQRFPCDVAIVLAAADRAVESGKELETLVSKLAALHVKRDQMIDNDTWESEGARPTWRALTNAARIGFAALPAHREDR